MKLEDLFKKPETGPIFTPTSEGGWSVEPVLIAPTGTGTSKIAEVEAFQIPDYILNDPQQVGYPDKEMQDEIYGWVYDSVNKLADPDTRFRSTITDFGAGRGDISHWFSGGDAFKYTGFETNPILVQAGNQKYKESKYIDFTLIQQDFFDSNIKSDFTICVGTLNSIPTENKWGLFRRTMQKALETTEKAIIFVLSNKFDVEGFNDFPFKELFDHLPNNPFTIDCTKFEDIYMLVIYVDDFKQ